MMDKNPFKEYKENPTTEKRNELVEDNLYIVDILIREYLGKGVDYDDLYQVGALALISAVERFDPDRGYEFGTFATPTILGEIKKYFRDKGWSLKVPRRLKELSGTISRAKSKFENEYHRTPTVDELSEITGYPYEDIIEAMESAKAYGTYSLDKTYDDTGEDGDSSVFEKYTGVQEKGYDRVEMREIIQEVLSTFDEKNKFIFRERFLNGKTQTDIANELGVSQMTVSRAEKEMKERFSQELNK